MRIVQNMKRSASFKGFYQFSGWAYKLCAGLSLLCIGYGLVGALYLAPTDYQQGEAFRIIYVHVPCALLSLSIYTVMGCTSLIYIIWRIKIADLIAEVSAPIGMSFTFLALITGALWGKPMWGTFWVWDARLTSELLLLFLYLGYMGLRNALRTRELAAKAAGLLAMIGLMDVPIVHYSVVWWHTLHQGATLSPFKKPSMDWAMFYPLLAMILGFLFFYLTLILLHSRYEILARSAHTRWVKVTLQGTKGSYR